jgi:multidrug efflux system membrane fusion protein
MAFRFRAHRISAIVVLVAAALWVGTGKFASVGSEEAHAAQPESARTEPPKAAEAGPVLRTVAAIPPVFADHARTIRISGATDADKRAVLAARAGGIIRTLAVKQGDGVAASQVVMAIEGPEVVARIATARALLTQRRQELDVAEKLFRSGNTAELQLIAQRAALAAAEAQVSEAEAELDRLTLRAPFAGIIHTVYV